MLLIGCSAEPLRGRLVSAAYLWFDMVAHQAFVLVLGSTPVRLGLSSGWNLSPTEYLQSKIQNFVTRRSA